MAIYHLTANIISRARGQSAVAAAAYRAGTVLRDRRYGITHDYRGRQVVVHAEIMTPPGTPAWACDRERLWNEVEANEHRKDSQLARVIEVALPIELSADEHVALVRDYVAREFVAKGMIADLCVRANAGNPNAHILLTLRAMGALGFAAKERGWNGRAALLGWRAAWGARVNAHLGRAGHAVRVDHRSLEAQQVELTPGRRIGVGMTRRGGAPLAAHLLERIDEQRRIAAQNGAAMLEDPTVALRALTHQRPTFSREDLSRFLRPRTSGAPQFDAVLAAAIASGELVALARADGTGQLFTTRDMIEAEKSLLRRSSSMAARRGHGIAADRASVWAARHELNRAEHRLFEYLVGEGDVAAAAVPDAARMRILAAARDAWTDAGFSASVFTAQVGPDDEPTHPPAGADVNRGSVLWVQDAHTAGIKQLERLLAVADKARAKAVLIADAVELGALGATAPFSDLLRHLGR